MSIGYWNGYGLSYCSGKLRSGQVAKLQKAHHEGVFTPEIEEGRIGWSTKATLAGHLISFILVVAQFPPTFSRRPVISTRDVDLLTPDAPNVSHFSSYLSLPP